MIATSTGCQKSLRSPIKWVGGKRFLVPRLQELYSDHRHRRFVEPFCGGLSVALGLRPERALLADVNPHVVNFWEWVQRGLVISMPMAKEASVFASYRDRFNALSSGPAAKTADAAALFYFLNRTCHGGLCRFNRQGHFNAPFAKDGRSVKFKRTFSAYGSVMAGWTFACSDFESCPVERGDFIYIDPPFDGVFTSYWSSGFGWDDQVRLAEWTARHDGPVVVSNAATDRIVELYADRGFAVARLKAPRRINCTGDRAPADEILAICGAADAKGG